LQLTWIAFLTCESVGVYELVRRRCRFIACDGEQDGDYGFGAFTAVIRKCYTDFGVRIDIDPTPIRPDGASGYERSHCAVGTIHYEDVDGDPKQKDQKQKQTGLLIYLKASLTGDEPADVLNYARTHRSFPHEPTADQFFTESQFESYRALGYHIGRAVFEDSSQPAEAEQHWDDAAHRSVVGQVFPRPRDRWVPPPPHFGPSYQESNKEYLAVQSALRTESLLRRLKAFGKNDS
jgi:hypothetical protein